MSNYHVMTADIYGNSFRVVFHVPVPSANNLVGVNYRTCLASRGAVVSQVPDDRLGSGEQAALDSGALLEHAETFASNPGMDLAAKRAQLDARYNELKNPVGEFLQRNVGNVYSYWGYDRVVP